MRNPIALTAALILLGGCTLLRPASDMEKLTPKAETGRVAARADLPFLAPEQTGSWVLVSTTAPVTLPSSTWVNDLGFSGLPPLMAQALANNPSLAQAQARLVQAKALSGRALGALFPTLTAQGEVSRGRSASFDPNFRPGVETRSTAGLILDWPLDLFGRISGQLDAAKRQTDASRAEVAATRLQLQVAVAQTYIGLLAAHRAEAAWAEAMTAAEEQNRLIQLRYAAGDIPLTTAQPVFATLQSLRVQALNVAEQKTNLQNALAALVGEAPRAFALSDADLAHVSEQALAVPHEISSTALLNRPDIRAGANQVAAANANIGAARAAFLPSINLGASAGFTANGGSLFDWSNRTWSVGPLVSLPILSGGALRSNLDRAWGLYEEAVALYRGQVLGAYREVADALTAVQATEARAQSGQLAATAMARAARALEARYVAGDVAKVEWLDVKVMAAQTAASQALAEGAAHAAVAQAYGALGGGL